MAKLETVEGIGTVYARKLREAGISTTQALLKKGSLPGRRAEIAAQAGVAPALVLEWVNHADLFRIKGVGEEYADLLEEAGVDTVPELAQRNPQNLHQKIHAVNQQKRMVRREPTEDQVADWIAQAKMLPRVIQY